LSRIEEVERVDGVKELGNPGRKSKMIIGQNLLELKYQ